MVIGKTKKRIEALENRIKDLSANVSILATRLNEVQKENTELKAKVEDLTFTVNNMSDENRPLTQQELMREWHTGEETKK